MRKPGACQLPLLLVLCFILTIPLAMAGDPVVVFGGWDHASRNLWNIYRISANGRAERLVSSPANDNSPFGFPDGKAVGYLVVKKESELREIFRVDLESGVSTSLGISIRINTSCQVSPDQRQLACADKCGTHDQIFVFDLATGRPRQITNLDNHCLDPSWSPDGENLAYSTGSAAGPVGESAKPDAIHLAIFNFQSGEHRQLTMAPSMLDQYPRWSPGACQAL